MEAALIPSLLTSTSRPHGMQTRVVPFLNFAIFHLLSLLLPVSQITIRSYPQHMIAASFLMNRTRKTEIVGSHQFFTEEAQLIPRFSLVESDQLTQIMLYVRKIMRRWCNDIAGLDYAHSVNSVPVPEQSPRGFRYRFPFALSQRDLNMLVFKGI
jgi:hypothetical protein